MKAAALHRWRYRALAVLVLLCWGAAKVPFERRLGAEQRRLRFGGARVSVEMRDHIGQGAAIALLGGFRGLVADYLWITAHVAWERKEWFRMRSLMEIVCLLQPRSVLFWDMSAWHMAWNISQEVLEDPDEPRMAKRAWAQRQWVRAGRHLLERGVENIPDRYELWARLAWLCDQKAGDHLAAVEYWRRAAAFPEAPCFATRQIGYQLEAAGRFEEAYRFWRQLWQGHPDKAASPLMLWDRIAERVRHLEDRLGVAPQDRLDTRDAPPPAR